MDTCQRVTYHLTIRRHFLCKYCSTVKNHSIKFWLICSILHGCSSTNRRLQFAKLVSRRPAYAMHGLINQISVSFTSSLPKLKYLKYYRKGALHIGCFKRQEKKYVALSYRDSTSNKVQLKSICSRHNHRLQCKHPGIWRCMKIQIS